MFRFKRNARTHPVLLTPVSRVVPVKVIFGEEITHVGSGESRSLQPSSTVSHNMKGKTPFTITFSGGIVVSLELALRAKRKKTTWTYHWLESMSKRLFLLAKVRQVKVRLYLAGNNL